MMVSGKATQEENRRYLRNDHKSMKNLALALKKVSVFRHEMDVKRQAARMQKASRFKMISTADKVAFPCPKLCSRVLTLMNARQIVTI